MSFDISSVNGKKKNKKVANFGSSSSSEIISSSLSTSKSQANRIGPRVFKCVILGDGGVGKSGRFNYFTSVNNSGRFSPSEFLLPTNHRPREIYYRSIADDVKYIFTTTLFFSCFVAVRIDSVSIESFDFSELTRRSLSLRKLRSL